MVSGLPASDGGPSYSVPRLSQALSAAGIVSGIHSDELPEDFEAVGRIADVYLRDFAGIPGLDKLHVSHGLRRGLRLATRSVDIVHDHGLWRMANVYAGDAARSRGLPLVVSPRGMLGAAPLAFSKLSKRLFWRLAQQRAVADAALWHATSASEYEEIRAFGIDAPVAVIPNGVDLPPSTGPAPARGRTVLFLSRIHPKKGLEVLLEAWVRVAAEFPGWRLRIVGPGEPQHLRDLHDRVNRLHAPRVSVEGALYGADKWRAYREAGVYVLPTLNENFGLTVAEALACRTPAIVSKGAPWQGLETHGCGWWIDLGPDALTAGLREALVAPPEALAVMGLRGEAWVREAFAWTTIGVQMAEVYQWLCDRGPKPDTIRSY